MSPAPQATATATRNQLLARLGLPAGTQEDTLGETHQRIGEFLDTAPSDLRAWADRRQQETDRIFHLLTGPETDLADLAVTRKAPAPALTRMPLWARWGVGLAAVALVVFGVYWIGRPTSDLPPMTAAQTASPTPTPALDQARVAELMGRIQANPNDTESLLGLGDLYMAAGDYANAGTFFGKVLAQQEGHEKALIGSGVAAFNSGNLAEAEKHLARAGELYPNNAEVQYDLGFLYMTTQRTEQMKAAWARVVEIAPESGYAKTVQSHVGSVKTASPSATPAK